MLHYRGWLGRGIFRIEWSLVSLMTKGGWGCHMHMVRLYSKWSGLYLRVVQEFLVVLEVFVKNYGSNRSNHEL